MKNKRSIKTFGVLLVALLAGSFLFSSPAAADSDIDCQVVAQAINPTETEFTSDWVNLLDGSISATATDQDEMTVPVDAVVWNLFADVDVAPGANELWRITVADDGVSAGLTCDITGTNTSCSDTSFIGHGSVASGSDLSVLISGAAGASDPAAAAELRFSFCLSRER